MFITERSYKERAVMASETTAVRARSAIERDAEELAALIEKGGFWNLAPDWVPRAGYLANPPKSVLRRVETGLRGLL
ncbi:hypothetical protein [Streptomyces antimicrobicus]|uniref:Uncharacterized protein n=1 Tax=Streptomyces antimicrobicus TaxID=2883108 RepID=A0ABS8B4G5_9ACTN|nr:hypothetical protein [Streptomyces antimicrobicus]MCB5179518.1 hypothetical protein [Streptomyces antimicrobicus]